MLLRTRRLIGATLVFVFLAAACASDDDETTESADPVITTTTTSAPETTSAPTTTSAPETTTTTTTAAPEEPEPPARVDFYFTETTTGQDMLSFGTQEEADCVREALGDTVFEVLVGTPVLALTASGGGATTAVPVFDCLKPRSAAIIAAALMDARLSGDWGPDTRSCISDLAEDNPPLVLVGLGMVTIDEIGSTISTWRDFGLGVYNCLSNESRVALLAVMQRAVDAITVIERDIVPNLLDSEVECIRSILGDDGYAELLAAPSANYAFATGEEWPDCVSDETYRKIFVHLNDVAFFGIPDDTRACLETFAVDNPEYVSLLRVGDEQRAAMSEAHLAAVAESGLRIYDCLNEPLRSQAQGFLAASLLPGPPVVVRPSELPADFVLTETTSGQEVVDLLTENEVACMRSGLDEAAFTAFTAAPAMSVLQDTGEGASTAASLFVCLEEGSLSLIGAAFMDAAAGGWSAEARMCVADAIQARPELVVDWLDADDNDADFMPESLDC